MTSESAGRLRAIDLFAGVGGSSTGATAAGVEVVAAVDYWALAESTYSANFPNVRFLRKKCEDVDVKKLANDLGSIDLLIASPECTSHTCAKGSGPRSEDSRRTAFQVIRFARAFRPRWIAVENVVHMRSWHAYESWIGKLKKLGYKLREQVINAADYGVPQARRRLFVIGDRERAPREVLPSPVPRKTASDILDRNGHFKFSPLRACGRAPATLERAERALSAVGHNQPFLLVYYGTDGAGGWQPVDVPLRTLTTLDRFAVVKPGPHGHVMRMLQVPEIKAAMGFPVDYRIDCGSRRERIKLLGNAVCPPVMEAVVATLISDSASS